MFLCLFVGGGGGQQEIPKGLEGEEEDGKALFERRRERERSRIQNGKRKNIKNKDWILKKKEVSPPTMADIGNSHKTCTLALQKTRQGRCSPRLQVHRTKAQTSFLKPPWQLVMSNNV